MADREVLDPESYYEATLGVKLLYLGMKGVKEGLKFVVLIFFGVLLFVETRNLTTTIALWIVILFMASQTEVAGILQRSLDYFRVHGVPPPRELLSFRVTLLDTFKFSSFAAAIALSIAAVAWVSPSGNGIVILAPYFAFAANICLVLAYSSFYWSRRIRDVERGKVNWAYSVVLGIVPLFVIAGGTAVISGESGLSGITTLCRPSDQ